MSVLSFGCVLFVNRNEYLVGVLCYHVCVRACVCVCVCVCEVVCGFTPTNLISNFEHVF